jgi:signal transduction histidine kinase
MAATLTTGSPGPGDAPAVASTALVVDPAASLDLAAAARAALTTVAATWLAWWTAAGGLQLLLTPPEGQSHIAVPLATVWLVAAAVLAGTRVLPVRRRGTVILVVVPAVAVVTVAAREASGLVPPWIQVTLAGGMVMAAAGLLRGVRVWLVAVVVSTAVVLIPQRVDELLRDDAPNRIGVPLVEAAVVIGFATVALLLGLAVRTAADRTDQALAAEDRAGIDVAAAQAQSHDVAQQMRLLHDTALNTLSAVGLGAGGKVGLLRSRCQDDARRLREAVRRTDATPRRAAEVLTRIRDRAALYGIELTERVDAPAAAVSLPPEVADALAGAAEEALLNVAKHADTRAATLAATPLSDDGLQITIADSGRGFVVDATTSSPVQLGRGIRESILARMAAVGGRGLVRSEPSVGTAVELTWSGRHQMAPTVSSPADLWATVSRFLTALVAIATVFGILAVIVEWGALARPWVAILGAVLLGGWGWLVLRYQQRMPTALAVLTAVLASLAALWTPVADSYCASSVSSFGWLDARLALMMVVVLALPRWGPRSAAIALYVVATLVGGELAGRVYPACDRWGTIAAVFSFGILLAVATFAVTLRRQLATVERARAARVAAERTRALQDAVRQERQAWMAPALDRTEPLLQQLGDGRRAPDDPQVQDEAHREAAFLRSLVTVAEAPVGVREPLRDLVLGARDAGAAVEVRGELGRVSPPGPEEQHLLDVLAAVVAATVRHLRRVPAPIDLHLLAEDDAVTLSLVVNGTSGDAWVRTLPGSEAMTVWSDPAGASVELRWRVVRRAVGAAAPPAVSG